MGNSNSVMGSEMQSKANSIHLDGGVKPTAAVPVEEYVNICDESNPTNLLLCVVSL